MTHSSNAAGERRLYDGVQAVAVDHGGTIEPGGLVIEIDLGGKTSDRCGDFGNSDELAHVDHLWASVSRRVVSCDLPGPAGSRHGSFIAPCLGLFPERVEPLGNPFVNCPVGTSQGGANCGGDSLSGSTEMFDVQLTSPLGQLCCPT